MDMLKRSRAALAAAFLFTCVAAAFEAPAVAAKPLGAFTTRGAWTFYSAPGLHPPKLNATRAVGAKLAPGYLMLANFKNLGFSRPMVGQSGPLIIDSRLQPAWFAPVPIANLAMNLEVQSYNGQPALSWWQGVISKTGLTVSGEDVVVGQNYRTLATLRGDTKDGWVISGHEMVISGHDAWVTAYRKVPMNLTPEHGSATGMLLDSAIQEYDLQTGALLYSWDALGHIPLTQSKTRPGAPGTSAASVPWDAYHVNSIQLIPTSGSFLVAMRNTWGVYLVDMATGNIKWTLGGSASNFKFGPHAAFSWEHDARLSSTGVLTMFDDAWAGVGPTNRPSRGLVLKLDTAAHTAMLVAQYKRGNDFVAAFLGSMQQLPGGKALVGWGSAPYFTEFSATGKVLLDATFPNPDQSYRAFVQGWVGKPSFPPAGAVRTVNGRATVYASWDGATLVARWRVLAGTSSKRLRAVATVRKSGFETAIALRSRSKAYKVQALDRGGHVLGTSVVFPGKKRGLSFY